MSDPAVAPRDLAFEAYNGVELTLPTGRTLRAPRALSMVAGLQFWELLERFERAAPGDSGFAQLRELCEKFPLAVGLAPEDFSDLSLGEFIDVVKRFLFHRRRPAWLFELSGGGGPAEFGEVPAGVIAGAPSAAAAPLSSSS